MEDEINMLFRPEELIYWCFPWTVQFPTLYHRYPTISIHPIFGARHGTIYYLPVIEERDELERELSTEQIRIEELPDDGDEDDGVTHEQHQQRYIVEEPPDSEDEQMD